MVGAEVTAIIAAGSAVLGGVIVAGSNYAINRAQAADARNSELRRALIDLGEVVSRIDLQLRREPKPGKMIRAINDALAKYAPKLDHVTELTYRRLLEPGLDELAAAISRALSTALVLAPPSLLPALQQLTEAMEDADQRDDEWWVRWNAARNNYFLWCREEVGHTVPEPTEDVEGPDELA